jgi:hypothetical protein
MKLKTFITFVFAALSFFVKAQDIITLKSGEEIKAHIVRLTQKEVFYTLASSPDTLLLQRQELTKLYYNTGIVIYLEQLQMPEFTSEAFSDSLYLLGKRDAGFYYKGYRPAATGTLIASIFVPWGLIPAIACSVTPPSIQNLGFPDQTLIKNPSYYKGYRDNAFKIKKKKVWRNFAIGTGAVVGLYVISFAALAAMYTL